MFVEWGKELKCVLHPLMRVRKLPRKIAVALTTLEKKFRISVIINLWLELGKNEAAKGSFDVKCSTFEKCKIICCNMCFTKQKRDVIHWLVGFVLLGNSLSLIFQNKKKKNVVISFQLYYIKSLSRSNKQRIHTSLSVKFFFHEYFYQTISHLGLLLGKRRIRDVNL